MGSVCRAEGRHTRFLGTHMISTYARLFRIAGPSFFWIGLFARLPIAMHTIGALTFVTAQSNNYALGGLAAGAVGIGSAIGAPISGYLADRIGQKPVLIVTALANAAAIAALILVVASAPDFTPAISAWTLILSALVGFSAPQASSMARVRWMAMSKGPKAAQLSAALSYESTADEITFVLGPALVGLFASLIAPWLPLAIAAALAVTMVLAFAFHPTVNEVVITSRDTPAPKISASIWAQVAIPVLGMIAMGTFFGATSTAVTAFAGENGNSSLGGLLYACMGLTSAVTALSVALWSPRFSIAARWLSCAAAMLATTSLLHLPTTMPVMIATLMLVGLFVGPTMVTIFSVGSLVAPASRLGTVMTLLASGIVAGSALGSSIAGALAESSGASAAFWVSAAASVAMVIFAAISAWAIPASRHKI